MINKYIGESITYELVLKDDSGTVLPNELPIIKVMDSTGSTRTTGTGTYSTGGTYSHISSTDGSWVSGPIKYDWIVKSSTGTGILAIQNEIRLISGTTEPDSYIYANELVSYYGRIGDYIDENSQDKIICSYDYINRLLESLNITSPREKNSNGLYDESLRSMNAWFAIYNIVQDDQINRVKGDEIPWYKRFYDNGMEIYEDIKKKRIVFTDQVSSVESGICKPYRTAGSSFGTLENNYDRSYGKGFQGSDFTRTWIVEITGTGTAGELREGTFKWTNDGWLGSSIGITDFDWIDLEDEVFIRFDKGGSTGSAGIFNVGDKWEFITNPIAKQKGGINGARSYL